MIVAQLLGALAFFAQPAVVAPPMPKYPVTITTADRTALDAASRDLCGRRVALLGEGPTHGDGHTEAFKVELVRRLVERCGYDAIAFESRFYEFVAFDRAVRSHDATPTMLADAVGALWKFHREFMPLTDFLFARATAKRLRVAGLDFQMGGLGETYTNERMIPELTQDLSAPQASECRATFSHWENSSYPADNPYGRVQNDQLLSCVGAMQTAVLATRKGRDRTERLAMIDNLRRMLEVDLGTPAEKRAAREDALFANFLNVRAGLPSHAKIIVWGATTHLAKDASASHGFGGFASLGNRIHGAFGNRAFSLGFSARGGSFRQSRNLIPLVPPASTLEQDVSRGTGRDTVYLDARRLAALGVRRSGALDHAYPLADWSRIVDGMVVFAEEWPAQTVRPGY